jgi:hypothetical protein
VNVFVLCAGRTASTTFIRSASKLEGFTAAHESNSSNLFDERFSYPSNHIEADNRLSWFLGALDEKYGDSAYYVYILRDPDRIAKSYVRRWRLTVSIVKAFGHGILMRPSISRKDRFLISKFYVQTVDKNIRMFLKDKTNVFYFDLESPKKSFLGFCDFIGVQCPESALNEWDIHYNENKNDNLLFLLFKLFRKVYRFIKGAL